MNYSDEESVNELKHLQPPALVFDHSDKENDSFIENNFKSQSTKINMNLSQTSPTYIEPAVLRSLKSKKNIHQHLTIPNINGKQYTQRTKSAEGIKKTKKKMRSNSKSRSPKSRNSSSRPPNRKRKTNKKIIRLKEDIRRLESEKRELRKELEESESKKFDLRLYRELKVEFDEMKRKYEGKIKNIKQTKVCQKCSELKEILIQKNKKYEEIKAEHKESIDSIEKQSIILRADKLEFAAKISDLKSKKTEFEDKLLQYENKKEEYIAEIERLKMENNEMKQKNEEFIEQLEECRFKIKEYISTMEKSEEINEQLIDEREECESAKAEYISEIKKLKMEKNEIKENTLELKMEYDNKCKEHAKMNEDYNKLFDKLSAVKNKYEKECEVKTFVIEENNKQKNEIESIYSENDALRSDLMGLELKYKSLLKDLNEKDDKLQTMENKLQTMENKLRNKIEENEMKKLKEKISNVTTEKQLIENKCQQLRMEVLKLTHKHKLKVTENNRIILLKENEIIKLEIFVKDNERIINKLSLEKEATNNGKYIEKIQYLENELEEERETFQRLTDKYSSDCKGYQYIVNLYQQESETLKSKIGNLENKVRCKRIMEIKSMYTDLITQRDVKIEILNKIIQNYEQKLLQMTIDHSNEIYLIRKRQ